MSEHDRTINTLPTDPASRATEVVATQLPAIIRAAYAEQTAELEQLRVGVETEAERKRGIYEHAANAVVERKEIQAECERLRDENRKLASDINAKSMVEDIGKSAIKEGFGGERSKECQGIGTTVGGRYVVLHCDCARIVLTDCNRLRAELATASFERDHRPRDQRKDE